MFWGTMLRELHELLYFVSFSVRIEAGGARVGNSGPTLPQNIRGPTSIYRAPLFVMGLCPPSGAPPRSLFFAQPRLCPRFGELISL